MNIWKKNYHTVFSDFLEVYKQKIEKKHNIWLAENPLNKLEKKEAMTQCVHYIDDSESSLP